MVAEYPGKLSNPSTLFEHRIKVKRISSLSFQIRESVKM